MLQDPRHPGAHQRSGSLGPGSLRLLSPPGPASAAAFHSLALSWELGCGQVWIWTGSSKGVESQLCVGMLRNNRRFKNLVSRSLGGTAKGWVWPRFSPPEMEFQGAERRPRHVT